MNNINKKEIEAKKSSKFSFSLIKNSLLWVFWKKEKVEELEVSPTGDINEKPVNLELEIKEESIIDKAKSTVKETLSDLGNTFATVSDDVNEKVEDNDFLKEYDDYKYLKNWNIAVLKKNCLVALWAKRRDYWWVLNKNWERIIPQCYVEIKELENWCYACKWLKCNANYEDYNMEWTIYDEDWDVIAQNIENYFFKDNNFYVKIDGFWPYANYWILNDQWKRLYPKKYFWNLDSEDKIKNKKDWFIPVWFNYRPLEDRFTDKAKPEMWLRVLKHENGRIDGNEKVYYWIWEFNDWAMLAKVAYSGKKWCFDEDFNLLIPWVYNEVGEFKDWVALLCKYNRDNWNMEYSFKKKDGTSLWTKKVLWRWWMFKTDMTYDDAHEFNDWLAAVCKNGLWWFIDNNGNAITNLEFSEISDFSNGKAEVVKRVGWKVIRFWINKKWEYLLWRDDSQEDFAKYESKYWKEVINLLRLWKNYQAIEKVKEWIYAVRWYKWKVYRLIDIDWNHIDWEDFYSFKSLKNWMYKFETKKDWNGSEWSLFDKDFKKVNDNAFIDIKEFEGWIAAVCVKVKVYWWYTYRRRFINEKWEFINDKTYYNVWDFENWKAKVRDEKDSEKYFIDVNWNRIE